jgi:hypothetical protein
MMEREKLLRELREQISTSADAFESTADEALCAAFAAGQRSAGAPPAAVDVDLFVTALVMHVREAVFDYGREAGDAVSTAIREVHRAYFAQHPQPAVREKLTSEQADSIEAEMRRLEADPQVSKRELRLFMQSLMPCGHSVGELLTCPDPPFGCVKCNANPAVREDGPSYDELAAAAVEAAESFALESAPELKSLAARLAAPKAEQPVEGT